MRSDPTLGERILWRELRARRIGIKVRRQHPIGPFIPDFVCFEHRMIIEVDGDSHDGRDLSADRARDRWFHENGWYVLRFWDDDVIRRREEVLATLWLAIHNRDAVHDPLDLQ